MSSNAIFGRYWDANSVVHRLDPRTKLIATLILIIAVFMATSWPAMAFMAVVMFSLFALSEIPFPQALRSVIPLLFIAILAAFVNFIFVREGDALIDWGWLEITTGGLNSGAFVCVRLMLLLLLGSLLTMTTTTMDITEATETLLSPLSKLGVPTYEFAFVMGTALKFLPQFADEFQTIRAAQICRGAKLASSPLRGFEALTSMLVPMFASVFRHADTLSAAMDARCYQDAQKRTRLHPLCFKKMDGIAFVLVSLVLAASVLLAHFLH